MTEAERFNMRATFLWWVLLFAGSMGAMLWTASHKAIVISDVPYGQEPIGSSPHPVQERELSLKADPGDRNVFRIPLGKGVKAEDVAVENCYMDGELHVFLRDAESGLYETEAVTGDIAHVTAASFEQQDGGVLLKLRMDGIYEYRSSLENELLKIELSAPREMYKLIVVIDPAGGGSDTGAVVASVSEKNVALQVGRAVQRQWENSNVRIYVTRLEDAALSDEQRIALIDSVEADLYIRLSLETDADQRRYGICGMYNELYFIPEFGNVQLADVLVRNVTIASGNRAVGLQPAEEDSVLQTLQIPAAEVKLGYLSNEQERALLAQDAYYEKLAEGIVKAVEEVYKNYYE